MSSNVSNLLNNLGVRQEDGSRCYAGAYLLWGFIFAYAVSASRPLKIALKLDHNVSPREDVSKYGEQAVKDGKISQKTLKMLKRNEAAHANNVENYPLFAASGKGQRNRPLQLLA